MKKILKTNLFENIPQIDEHIVDEKLQKALASLNKKIVVLDDDPTGVQTVHDVSVYTDWLEETISAGFAEENPMFFILTNSRAFTADYTTQVHKIIAQRIVAESKKTNKEFIIISRSDRITRSHDPFTPVIPSCVSARALSTENSIKSTPALANPSYTAKSPFPFVMTVTRSPFTFACTTNSRNRSLSVGSPPVNTTRSAVVRSTSQSSSLAAFRYVPLPVRIAPASHSSLSARPSFPSASVLPSPIPRFQGL